MVDLKDFMCIVHVQEKLYLVDREAFYLLCSLQQVNFGHEDDLDFDRNTEKKKIYVLTLNWLIDRGKAVHLEQNPTHLIIRFIE